MMNLLTWLRRLRNSWLAEGEEEARRERARDPLSHPALQRMSLEELADLPFDRGILPDRPGLIRPQDPVRRSA